MSAGPDLAPSAEAAVRARAPAEASPYSTGGHIVRFYSRDDDLAHTVADFLADGLSTGDVVAAIAVEAHERAFRDGLQSKGFDVENACATGRLLFLDATAMLSRFMRDGDPDPRLFDSVVGELIRDTVARANGARVRAYGEMVDVLWQRGARKGAIRLEELWNDLRAGNPFTLLCAYAMGGFFKEPEAAHLVCQTHTHVVGGEPARSNAPTAEARATGLPPQHSQALALEIAHREEVEQTLRESLRELRAKEEELRANTEQLRDLIENAAVGIHSVAPDGTILWANRAELEMLGYAAEEYVGHSLAEFYVDPAALGEVIARLGRGEALQDHEAQMRAKDGSTKYVVVSSNAYFEHGKFVHTRCFTRDITERKSFERFRATAAERTNQLVTITSAIADAVTSDEVLQAVVDHVAVALGASSAALWLVESDGQKIKLSRAVGYGAAASRELDELPLDATPTVPVVDAIRRREPIWIPSQEALLRDYPHLRGSATAGRSYRIVCLPLVSQDRTLGALGITIDESREATEDERGFLLLVARYAGQAIERVRLLDAERRSRAIADRAADRVEQLYRFAQSVVSAGRVEEVFEAALDAIEAALRTNRGAILIYDDQNVMRFSASRGLSEEYRRAVEGHSPWSPDATAPQPVLVPDVQSDASMRAYLPLFAQEKIGSLAFIPLVTRSRLIGKFMVYYDETHEYSSHELDLALSIAAHLASVTARFTAIARLEQTIRYNELFAGVLAHDLRNPLGALMTSARILLRRQQEDDGRTAKTVDRILGTGRRMERMIAQLFDLTRVRVGGGMQVAPCLSNLEEICGQAIDELELAHPSWNIHRDAVGDLVGNWDPDRLLQIVSNLVGNAGQHGHTGAPIAVSLDGRAVDVVTLDVHNEGDIPKAMLLGLFDPFRGTRRPGDSRGLGLGLFIVKELVRAHGGTVDVTSSPSAGTTFSVRLPRQTPRAAERP